MTRRIAILGLAEVEPLPDLTGYEIWSVNSWLAEDEDGIHIDRLFECHRPVDRPWRTEAHWQRCRENTDRLWTFYPNLLGGGHVYPVLQVLERYRPFMANSFAWILALILYEHENGQRVDEVRLLRIVFESFHETWLEKASVCYWLGLLEGRGIKITLSPGSAELLHATPLYGLQDTKAKHARLYHRYQVSSNYTDTLYGLNNEARTSERSRQ